MIKRGILFLATIALLASPATGARAAVVFDTTGSASTGFFQFGRTGIIEKVAQSFLTVGPLTAGNLTFDGTFNESGLGADSDFFMEIRLDVMGEPDGVIAISNETFDTTDIVGLGPTDLQFTFSGVTLLDATTYHLVIQDSLPDLDDDDFRIKVSETSEYADGSMKRFDGTVWINASAVQDYFGVFDQDVTLSAADAITVPVDLSTITALPFAVSGTCDSDTQNQLEVTITEDGSPLNTVDKSFVTCELSDTWDAGTMGAAAWDSDFLITLYDIVEGTFGTRVLPLLDEITVTVAVVGNTNEAPPVIDPAATDDDFGFLGNLIRDALIFLFIPNEAALSRFADLFSLVVAKPPIGFITASVAAFQLLEEGTPAFTLEGTAGLSEYFDPIKAAISTFLLLLFGLWLIHRVSRINI